MAPTVIQDGAGLFVFLKYRLATAAFCFERLLLLFGHVDRTTSMNACCVISLLIGPSQTKKHEI